MLSLWGTKYVIITRPNSSRKLSFLQYAEPLIYAFLRPYCSLPVPVPAYSIIARCHVRLVLIPS